MLISLFWVANPYSRERVSAGEMPTAISRQALPATEASISRMQGRISGKFLVLDRRFSKFDLRTCLLPHSGRLVKHLCFLSLNVAPAMRP